MGMGDWRPGLRGDGGPGTELVSPGAGAWQPDWPRRVAEKEQREAGGD